MGEILTSLLPSGILTAILFFLLWFWFSERLKTAIKSETEKELKEHNAKIEHEYGEKLATHTATLTRGNELELTAFKHKLELAATERNFRFSHTFEKTAAAIEETYRHLVDLNELVGVSAAFSEGLDEAKQAELRIQLEAKWLAFQESFKKNKIFIPKVTAEQIKAFTMTLSTFQHKYGWLRKYEKSPTASHELLSKRSSEIEDLMHQIPKLLSALIGDFQKILGFPDEQSEKSVSQ